MTLLLWKAVLMELLNQRQWRDSHPPSFFRLNTAITKDKCLKYLS